MVKENFYYGYSNLQAFTFFLKFQVSQSVLLTNSNYIHIYNGNGNTTIVFSMRFHEIPASNIKKKQCHEKNTNNLQLVSQ